MSNPGNYRYNVPNRNLNFPAPPILSKIKTERLITMSDEEIKYHLEQFSKKNK